MDVATVLRKYTALSGTLTERSRRLWAATEAMELGHGGIAVVERATGISRSTITRGIRDVEWGKSDDLPPARARRPGAGRKHAIEKDRTLLDDLDSLIEPMTRGDPETPLRWTAKSVRNLAEELRARGHEVSYRTVARVLADAGFSLQANRKTREGEQHVDRDEQFRYIDRLVRAQLRRGAPAVSVDTKRKELVGNFKNPGREWRPKGEPEHVRVHDFIIPDQGKAIPYGVYDLSRDEGWVCVGIDHDTASFAVNAVRQWWKVMGRTAYPAADSLLITADVGGSNGPRVRLWKWELHKFANRTGLSITVCHFPPGTSKWNKIEHRLFSYIAIELERETACESRRDREPHRIHHDHFRPQDPFGDRSRLLSPRRQDHGPATRQNQARAPQVSWRLELYDPPHAASLILITYCVTGS